MPKHNYHTFPRFAAVALAIGVPADAADLPTQSRLGAVFADSSS